MYLVAGTTVCTESCGRPRDIHCVLIGDRLRESEAALECSPRLCGKRTHMRSYR